jgi:hypothetical protein
VSDLDFAESFAGTARNPLADQIRDRGADVLLAVFRLSKNALIHAVDNASVVEAAAQAATDLGGFAANVGMPATITYADKTVFVCGQLLRASRGIYESALELGEIVGRLGVSELSFEAGVTRENLQAFARSLSEATHDADKKETFASARIPNVALRKVEPLLVTKKPDDELPMQERIVRFYATALVVLRRFLDEIAAGRTLLPHRVKRLAQRLVVLSESKHPALLGMTAMAGAHRDDAGRALQAAILAVVVGRELTTNRVALSRVTMAALMSEIGRVRLAGATGRERFVTLSEADETRVPAASALVAVATGGVAPSSALRTTTLYEAAWLARQPVQGPLWQGQVAALPHSEILLLARLVVDQLAPLDTRPSASPSAALEAVAADPRTPRVLLRILVRVLGFIPSGTVVELETGEWAVVLGPSVRPEAFPMPRLRVVTDRKGRALERPHTIDVGEAARGDVLRITRALESAQARFNVTKAFLE